VQEVARGLGGESRTDPLIGCVWLRVLAKILPSRLELLGDLRVQKN